MFEMEPSASSILNFVIADDDAEDQFTIQKAIWEMNINHKITSVYNGAQLMDYLLRKGMYENCMEPSPDCVLLDLNMPLVNGFEVLRKIKGDRGLKQVPVYILTTSGNSFERNSLLNHGANGFYTKQPEESYLKKILEEIHDEICRVKTL